MIDSGVGGLSIYSKIRLLFPNFHYIYVLDNAVFPYGEKSEETIIKRVTTIINKICQLHSVTIAIISCNTASVVSLKILRKNFSFPIIGTVPAIKTAVLLTKNQVIGILATKITLNHQYTYNLINQFAFNCQIKMIGSTTLVRLVEDKLCGEHISLYLLNEILKPWLNTPNPPDTIVLGCTHFSLIKRELLSILPRGTNLVDSSVAIARRTAWILNNIMTPSSESTSLKINTAYYVKYTSKINRLIPVLKRYGFKIIDCLILD